MWVWDGDRKKVLRQTAQDRMKERRGTMVHLGMMFEARKQKFTGHVFFVFSLFLSLSQPNGRILSSFSQHMAHQMLPNLKRVNYFPLQTRSPFDLNLCDKIKSELNLTLIQPLVP